MEYIDEGGEWMQDDLYFYVMVLGLILVGFAWFIPNRRNRDERQGMEMVHMLTEIKQDMEQKMRLLSKQVGELQTEMEEMKLRSSAEGTSESEGNQHGLKLDRRYAEIFDLKQQGKSDEEIAKMLDMGVGEVSLIIQLHRMAAGRGTP